MFTGIVDHVGTIQNITFKDSGIELVVNTSFQDLILGESISVDGVCLTVAKIDKHNFHCQLSPETLEKSTASQYKKNQHVNLERALKYGDHIGGHIISGHIDSQAKITSITHDNGFVNIIISDIKKSHSPYLTPKGSVAINGVSLTMNEVLEDGFQITLIPHTLKNTTLSQLSVRDNVNIEYDLSIKNKTGKLVQPKKTTDLIEKALDDISKGKMIILVDDKDRENEGDLVMAAELVTSQSINFMAQYARGLICSPLCHEIFERLKIPMLVSDNNSKQKTPFGISIGAAHGITTGISAYDRAHTIRTIANKASSADDIVMPGHVFPLKASPKGLEQRQGHTEGSIELMKLAGLNKASVICEIMNPDGSMARMPDLLQFAAVHDLSIITIQDIINYKKQKSPVISAKMPLKNFGDFEIRVIQKNGLDHVCLISPEFDSTKPVLVRIHSECLTGDVFGSYRCDCGKQLNIALEKIANENGILIYLRQEGRGIGLANKIKAYALQDTGFDTVEANHKLGFDADMRDYEIAADILHEIEVTQIKLLTNNPKKLSSLTQYGLQVIERIPLETRPTKQNLTYLQTKKDKLGHLLTIGDM